MEFETASALSLQWGREVSLTKQVPEADNQYTPAESISTPYDSDSCELVSNASPPFFPFAQHPVSLQKDPRQMRRRLEKLPGVGGCGIVYHSPHPS